MTTSSMSDRFRRAIQSDDLTTAKRIYDRMTIQSEVASGSSSNNGTNVKFDIRNQASQPNSIHDPSSSHSYGHTHIQHHHQPNDVHSMHSTEALGNCLALSAAQFNTAKQSRVRERNREAVRIKSSLAIAVENGASIELIQWLLDMGHERGDFSRDIRGCTAVSLAAQNNRTDVIEACCIDAVAHAATLHHQRSLMYYGFRNNMNAFYEDGYDELEGDDRNSNASGDGDRSDGDLSPALTLVTAAASTPSRRPSPSPLYLARTDRFMDGKEMKEEALKAEHDDAKSSAGGSSEMDDIVGVTITRLLDCPDELGRTALSLASMKGHEDVVRLLLELGATLDLGDFEGNRPLHYASAYNQLIVVQLLIERGCSFAAKNVLGFTAADYAWNASLKSALEAFARAQFDVQRVRIRRKGGGRNEDSAPSLRQQAQSQQSNGKVANTPSQHDHTHNEKAKSAQSPSISKSLGLFPAQLPHSSPETSLPSSPQPPSQPKLTSHLRELF